jgi:hypothetical protein
MAIHLLASALNPAISSALVPTWLASRSSWHSFVSWSEAHFGQEFRIDLWGTPITATFAINLVYPGDTLTTSIFTAESGPRSFIAGLSPEAD